MSRFIPSAVLAAEDHRFFDHGGLDLLAVGRALVVNASRGEIAQGASTLTQQLVKNLLLGPERTWSRKIREGALALERRYPKTKILEAYFNTVDLGQHGRLTHLLRGVVDRGTGASARALGLGGAVAGKTGTTNDTRDAWFAGYSPRLVTVVWVGFDGAAPLELSGARAALPIWADFMRAAAALEDPGEFTVPPTVSFGRACGSLVPEAFLPPTEPEEPCEPAHVAGAPGHPALVLASPSDR